MSRKLKTFQIYGFLFLFVLFISALIGNLYRSKFTGQQSNIQSSLDSFTNMWSAEIDKIGPKSAYQKFKEETEKISHSNRHKYAHVFGDILFSKYGLLGISYCDESFNYGCYHSISANAIQKNGLGIVKDLNRECLILGTQGPILSCQHGIGHGVLASLGYTVENLKEASIECKKINSLETSGGCLSGVFMEYNFQTMLADDAHPRAYNEQNAFFPCPLLDQEYQRSCIFQQTQWWLQSLPGNSLAKLQKTDDLCSNIYNIDYKEECFKGIGNNIGEIVRWDASQTQKLCNSLDSSGARENCLLQAASVFNRTTGLKTDAIAICSSLTEDKKTVCLQLDKID